MQHDLKRIFDISVAALVLVVLSPLIAIIGIAIKHNDRGPIFFVQERVGRREKRFRCYKFRTMRAYLVRFLPSVFDRVLGRCSLSIGLVSQL